MLGFLPEFNHLERSSDADIFAIFGEDELKRRRAGRIPLDSKVVVRITEMHEADLVAIHGNDALIARNEYKSSWWNWFKRTTPRVMRMADEEIEARYGADALQRRKTYEAAHGSIFRRLTVTTWRSCDADIVAIDGADCLEDRKARRGYVEGVVHRRLDDASLVALYGLEALDRRQAYERKWSSTLDVREFVQPVDEELEGLGKLLAKQNLREVTDALQAKWLYFQTEPGIAYKAHFTGRRLLWQLWGDTFGMEEPRTAEEAQRELGELFETRKRAGV